MTKKDVETVAAPVSETPSKIKALSDPERMWAEISHTPLNLFSLPGQTAQKHCTPMFGALDKLLLRSKVPAIVVALEEAFSGDFNFDVADGFIVMTRKVK
jgi:hypothetical protein